jgi:hypothetical protein
MATILKRNKKENRIELLEDGKLIGYTKGDHKKGADDLHHMAISKGHDVMVIGELFDDEE